MVEKFVTSLTANTVQVGQAAHRITVNDRAATRATIFRRIAAAGYPAIERSDWAARDMKAKFEDDWDYSMIAIHHAGRNFVCNPGALQMQEVQEEHYLNGYGDVGYHYGIDCSGFIFEGRDIRYKGSHLDKFNTGVIGVVLLRNLTNVEEGGDGYAKARTHLKSVIGYDTTPKAPANQVAAVIALVDVLTDLFSISALGGHREFPFQEGKPCPGDIGMEVVKMLRSRKVIQAPSRS